MPSMSVERHRDRRGVGDMVVVDADHGLAGLAMRHVHGEHVIARDQPELLRQRLSTATPASPSSRAPRAPPRPAPEPQPSAPRAGDRAHGISRGPGGPATFTWSPASAIDVGSTWQVVDAWAMAASMAARSTAPGGHRTASDPPSPPAPFTFHPSAPRAATAAITRCASAPTSDGCSRRCASVLARMAAPSAARSPGFHRFARGGSGGAQVVERGAPAGALAVQAAR